MIVIALRESPPAENVGIPEIGDFRPILEQYRKPVIHWRRANDLGWDLPDCYGTN